MSKIFYYSFFTILVVLFSGCTYKDSSAKVVKNKNSFVVSKRYCVKSSVLLYYSKKQINKMFDNEAKKDALFLFLEENSPSHDSYEEFFNSNMINIDKKRTYFTDDLDNYCYEFEAVVSNPEKFFNDMNLENYSQENGNH
ncbi:hypothetical protein [Arcobacter sp. CECT 8985]|uniref:hypothetical protein n=1 Tax=Arcobacter sp. CECT 8985 TaxID=1935424 RepID=UPI00100C25A0|nr:hypothetical protein [Arcobacter sp. CECT 8985]RXJ87031.1 hypothetical protein CRU93_05520 [Arcobacter sp. CECT 8985]